MKTCSAFPKAPVLLEPHHQIVLCLISDTRGGGGGGGGRAYPSTEVRLVYSTAQSTGQSIN